jgi:hypothetical protein
MVGEPVEPLLILTPNKEAVDLLLTLMEDGSARPGHEPVFETLIPVRITLEDLHRYLYGNGDLVRIGFWITEGGVDPVAFPDPDPPLSPFG